MTDQRRALIVDDEASIRFVVSKALEERGWAVRKLDDGMDVEEALVHDAFELVVLDLMMPGMNGFEVLRKMRAVANGNWKTQPSVRVIALSGKAGDEGLDFAQRIGADAVLSKPFEVEELWRVIEG